MSLQLDLGTDFGGNQSSPADTVLRHELAYQLLEVDPLVCTPASFVARDPRRIDEIGVADLVQSITLSGQIEPVLARRMPSGGAHQYEIVCGIRRWAAAYWLRTNGNADFRLRLLLADLDPRAAYVASDHDNRVGEGVSPIERGRGMHRAIQSGLFTNQLSLSEALTERPATVSTLVRLANWPVDLIAAWPSPYDILMVDAERLSPALEDPDRRPKLLAAARELSERQKSRAEANDTRIARRTVVSLLRAAVKNESSRLGVADVHSKIATTNDGRVELRLFISMPISDKSKLLSEIEAHVDRAMLSRKTQQSDENLGG